MTDVGSHGNVMANGSPNVFCNGLAVHRMTDRFVCPLHGAGVTALNCSPRVLVNKLPAAHLASVGIDILPAVIVSGSQNTFVGET